MSDTHPFHSAFNSAPVSTGRRVLYVRLQKAVMSSALVCLLCFSDSIPRSNCPGVHAEKE